MFDMCNEKEFEVIRNLIKNPLKGTTWSVLACDSVQEKKTQTPRRSCAPGFRTVSDNDSSTKESPVKVDKTTRHHHKQSGASGKVNDCQASSKGSTSHATTAKKTLKSTKVTATNANQKTDKTTPFHSNVVANHSPEKAMPKKSAGSKKGEIDVTQRNDSEDNSLDLDAEGMREAMATI